ncbi:NAD(P)-dependent oxidoreductase [Arthrobacter sp. GN70]|nr:NAD(P)-dependent oxidoreductase [Arthrobacter sp. GN70]
MPTLVDHVPRILVLGSSGFIGSRVAASLAASGKAHVVAVSRKPDSGLRNHNATIAAADISVPGSLAPFLAGASAVVHSASYVGSDPDVAREVNEAGTRNVIEQCREAGVQRVIYVSTCSVYGSGPHRGLAEADAGYHPESNTSASRAAAEQAVLAYGGEVVRPNLVLGAGDRWVVPGLVKIMKVAGGWPGDGSALLSLIGVEALGELIAGLALAPRHAGQAFHAAYPEPVTVGSLVRGVAQAFGVESLRFLGDDSMALAALRGAGFSSHRVNLVTTDHWYSSDRLWEVAGCPPEAYPEALLSASYSVSRGLGRA